jgi:U4/U6.U5 tri-snRNP component SNU23
MAGVRRTWDRSYYEAKARDRLEYGDDIDEKNDSATKAKKAVKEEFKPAEVGEAGPAGSQRAFIKAREYKVDLDSKVGKVEIITPSASDATLGPGWTCDVCNCVLKDSTSYLDHINGRKHQRALGYSMRVEKSNVDNVKSKLESLKRKIESSKTVTKPTAIEDYESRIARQVAEEELKKKQKKEALAAKKLEVREEEVEQMDPELASILGFASFGGSKR